jgi:S-adenosylmethionine hydrolase
MPAGVHLAVVDPDVGAEGRDARRAVALLTAAEGRLLVGPDNGLLTLAAERFGGLVEAVEISNSHECLQPASRTFHGRDLFAPVAAALADGEALAELGDRMPTDGPDGPCRLELPTASVLDGAIVAHVLRVDHFGNLTLDASPAQLAELGARPGASLSVEVGGRAFVGRRALTFSEVPAGELLLYEDSTHRAALAVNRSSAAELLGLGSGQGLLLRLASQVSGS